MRFYRGIPVFLLLASFYARAQKDTLCPPWPKNRGSIFDPTGKKDTADKTLLPEKTVMFSKRVWSFMDFKEDLNKKLYNNYNPKLKIVPLYEIMNAWIVSGKIKCFRRSDFGYAKNTPLTPAEFRRACIKSDSVEERTINDKGEEIIAKNLKADTLTNDKILGFVVKEDWFFNKRSVLLEKKIIGLAPVYYDRKMESQKELYWVYYPECCDMLSSYFSFNPYGAKDLFSYRQLLEMRKFSSYVLKESNVYDRDKPENSKGYEAEGENTRNREKFDNKESDLWHN